MAIIDYGIQLPYSVKWQRVIGDTVLGAIVRCNHKLEWEKENENSVKVLLLALLTTSVSSNFSTSGQQVGLGKTVGENGVLQQLKQANDGSFNLGNFDDSRILDAKHNALTTVTIRDGRIDFTKRTEQTRQSLLQLLYEKGVRIVYISVKDQLTLD